jgi:hypothetical protein
LIDGGLEGFVYAALCEGDEERELELIKIGATLDPATRFHNAAFGRDEPYDIVYTRPDIIFGHSVLGQTCRGDLELRVLQFAGMHGLRYEDNDPDPASSADYRSGGSTELIRFDADSVDELASVIGSADDDVRGFFEGLIDRRDDGHLY